MSKSGRESQGDAWFGTTQWTEVIAARDREDVAGHHALENLCRTYWFPLYGYVRRRGYQPPDAEDLTQGFFAHLLGRDRLASVDRNKGRFRTFLLTCFDNYLRDEHDRRSTKKRGGEYHILSLDWEDAESRYRLDPPDERSPEIYFERRWALEVLGRALKQLRRSYDESGKGERFAQLKPYLTGDGGRGQLSTVADTLGMKEGAVRVAISRLRDEFRKALRAEIRDTVADGGDAEEEYRHLCHILTGSS